MALYSVAEAKNRLPALIAAAERGEAVTITRHGKPVVEIRAVGAPTPVRRRSPAEGLAWLQEELAKLNLPRSDVDNVALIDEMREADVDPGIADRW
ncbi:MAG: type II toxin-antitoxin system prevent-host-death family antitoxin [Acetobacteraceae bacterium]|nr:type II toxin-antitoxin system prevent-host-death family antitoxin [Acetobacteraceae bacterium]